ncbi:NAD-dependent malic enzyme [Phanerochaete sordida]|uniref:Malic enzyme n=1 Tax=Phanerochaete sordida TaxID=48140 RepID=A0A9P3G945_9APHY|nr:NAD-dependent malic enzyme [Phanerochaete sordida]
MASDPVFRVALHGSAVLTNPRFNKGTAFTAEERRAFGLTGRLPHRINMLDEQCARAWDQLDTCGSDLAKNTFLQSMRDQNWVLYYALIRRHLKELIPIIYTPTEAEAISNYSHLFRKSEGLYLTFVDQDAMEDDFLEQTKGRDIDLVVCSDAEQILGIGDQGVGGIGISTAKAAIYTLLAGTDPAKILSVTLDVGTDNDQLLDDPLYVGWPHRRVRGNDYDTFIDKFVQLVRKHLPHSLLHFEDFGVTNAYRLLEKYRDNHACFNDDVQGTGAVTLACVMAAVGVTKSKLSDQRIVVFGAGSAGLGITRQLRDGMVEIDGLSKDEANKRFYLVDKFGLIHERLEPSKVREAVREFVRPQGEWDDASLDGNGAVGLLETVKRARPTVLIGCSTVGGAFTEEVIREMKKHSERPIILPLSNPSRLHEVKPQDAMDWAEGKALIATGSPFPPCKLPGGKEYIVAECNNALIYPGLCFGAMLTKSRILTDSMIIAGTQRLASLSPALKNPEDALLPDFGDSPDVNLEVAIAVAEKAIEEGNATVDWKKEEVRERAVEKQWNPVYGVFVYDPQGDS